MLESFRWWYVLLVGVPLVASVALTVLVPAFGVLCLAVVLTGIVVVLLLTLDVVLGVLAWQHVKPIGG